MLKSFLQEFSWDIIFYLATGTKFTFITYRSDWEVPLLATLLNSNFGRALVVPVSAVDVASLKTSCAGCGWNCLAKQLLLQLVALWNKEANKSKNGGPMEEKHPKLAPGSSSLRCFFGVRLPLFFSGEAVDGASRLAIILVKLHEKLEPKPGQIGQY